MVNRDELARMNLEAPADWQDLLKPEYKDLIWLSNYNTAGTAKLVVNTMIQKYGHDEGIQYLVDLDKNIRFTPRAAPVPARTLAPASASSASASCMTASPRSTTTATRTSAHHPLQRHLLRGRRDRHVQGREAPQRCEAVDRVRSVSRVRGARCQPRFLSVPGHRQRHQPKEAAEFGLDPDNVMEYDFEDAKNNIKTYVEEVMTALGGGDDRFKTE